MADRWDVRRKRAEESRKKIEAQRARWEKNCERFPEHLKLARTWTSWSDVVDAISGDNYVVDQLRRLADEQTKRALQNDGHGNPNMAASDRFFAILFTLAAKELSRNGEPTCPEDAADESPDAAPKPL